MAPSEHPSDQAPLPHPTTQTAPTRDKCSRVFSTLSRFFPVKDLLRDGPIYTKVLRTIYLDFLTRKRFSSTRLVQDLLCYCDSIDYHEIQGKLFARSLLTVLPSGRERPDTTALVQLLYQCGVLQDLFMEVCNPPQCFSSSEKENSFNLTTWLLQDTCWSRVGPGGIRVVDLQMTYKESPLMLAARNRSPKVVLLFLRYDACVTSSWLLFHSAIEVLLFAPNRIHLSKEEEDKMEMCLNYVCRAVTKVDMERLEGLQKEGYCALHQEWPRIVPPARYKQPCALKHLCRTQIRQILSDNRAKSQKGSLPGTIDSLPLPVIIKDYLDLLSD